jgi:hypothetical protein
MIGLEQQGRYVYCGTDWKTEESRFDFRKRTDITSFFETPKPAPSLRNLDINRYRDFFNRA